MLVNGKAVSGCLYLAAFVDGAEVVTVEHLGGPHALDPVQQAFIECGAFQCGYCTPGICSDGEALLAEHPDPDDEQIKHYLSGNLCRCAAYPEIIDAVKMAARKQQGRPHRLNRKRDLEGGLPMSTAAMAGQEPWYRRLNREPMEHADRVQPRLDVRRL